MGVYFARVCLFAAISLTQMCNVAVAANYDNADILAVERNLKDPIATYNYETLRNDFTQHVLETKTPWSQETRFRGPYLKDILARFGFDKAKTIEVHAFDDFMPLIPTVEIEKYNPILAVEKACSEEDRQSDLCAADQEFRRLRMDDNGPFFVVWPLDQLVEAGIVNRNEMWTFFCRGPACSC